MTIDKKIDRILTRTHFDPQLLRLEITESAIMEDAEAAIIVMKKLRDLQIELYIDDFGTGYSSLSYLHRFPVNALKIDLSFVNRMMDSSNDLEIVPNSPNVGPHGGFDTLRYSANGCRKGQTMFDAGRLGRRAVSRPSVVIGANLDVIALGLPFCRRLVSRIPHPAALSFRV